MALDFDVIDIESFLFAALPVRFQDTEPDDFQNFISHLFIENGYNLVPTSYSPDYSAHIIVSNEGVKTAVQVRRYHEAHKIGVPEVHQIVAAQQYYNCQQAMVITTSSFQAAARELANKHEVISWGWQRLEKAIRDTFMEGQDYYTYFQNYTITESDVDHQLSMQVTGVEFSDSGSDPGSTIMTAEITNHSNEIVRLHCDLPIYINQKRKQFTATRWIEDSFINGAVHPGSTVELSFAFNRDQLSSYQKNDRLILSLHMMPQGERIMLEQRLSEVKKSCYLVTFCYGKRSTEYHEMIRFREEVLSYSVWGRQIIKGYYFIGSFVVPWMANHPQLRKWIRPLVFLGVCLCTSGFGFRNTSKNS